MTVSPTDRKQWYNTDPEFQSRMQQVALQPGGSAGLNSGASHPELNLPLLPTAPTISTNYVSPTPYLRINLLTHARTPARTKHPGWCAEFEFRVAPRRPGHRVRCRWAVGRWRR